MARETGRVNTFALELLDLQPTDRVLPGGRLVVAHRTDEAARRSFPASVYSFRGEAEVADALRVSGFGDVRTCRRAEGSALLSYAVAIRSLDPETGALRSTSGAALRSLADSPGASQSLSSPVDLVECRVASERQSNRAQSLKLPKRTSSSSWSGASRSLMGRTAPGTRTLAPSRSVARVSSQRRSTAFRRLTPRKNDGRSRAPRGRQVRA
jgi:hypothetical protein